MIWLLSYASRLTAASLLCTAGILVANRYADKLGWRSLIAYYAVRLSVIFVPVSLLGSLPTDMPGWYLHARWMAEDGLFPGVGFLTPYSLGFNALIALAVWIYNSPFSIIAMLSMVELLAVSLFLVAMRKLDGELSAKRTVILYLTSPVVFFHSWMGAQDEPLILLAVVIVFCLAVFNKPVWLWAVSMFGGIFFSKILAVFFLQPFGLVRKYKTVAICGAALAVYCGVSLCLGVNPFNLYFGREIGLNRVGSDDIMTYYTLGNIWMVFRFVPVAVQYAVFAAALAAVSARPLVRMFFQEADESARLLDCMKLLCVWALLFGMLYRMSFAAYFISVLPFMIWMFRKRIAVLAVWSVVLAAKDAFCMWISYNGEFSPLTRQIAICAYSAVLLALSIWLLFILFKPTRK